MTAKDYLKALLKGILLMLVLWFMMTVCLLGGTSILESL